MGKRHSARVEALKCGAVALERSRLGETFVAIHEDLTGRGEITMAYVTFVAWMKRFRKDPSLLPCADRNQDARPQRSQASPRSTNSQPTARKKRKSGEPFIGSIGISPDAWKPSTEPPDLKRLIGEDHE